MTGRRRENGRRPERLLQALAETREKDVDALRQIFPPERVTFTLQVKPSRVNRRRGPRSWPSWRWW